MWYVCDLILKVPNTNKHDVLKDQLVKQMVVSKDTSDSYSTQRNLATKKLTQLLCCMQQMLGNWGEVAYGTYLSPTSPEQHENGSDFHQCYY